MFTSAPTPRLAVPRLSEIRPPEAASAVRQAQTAVRNPAAKQAVAIASQSGSAPCSEPSAAAVRFPSSPGVATAAVIAASNAREITILVVRSFMTCCSLSTVP